MKSTDAVRTIMADQGVGANMLARVLKKSTRLVCDRLSQENISVSKLNEVLIPLGYKTVILPRDCPIPDGGYEIE